jgi:hypothetical protein
MSHQRHPDYDELIGYLGGQLESGDSLKLDHHLESCSECSWRLLTIEPGDLANLTARPWPHTAAVLAQIRAQAAAPKESTSELKPGWTQVLRLGLDELAERLRTLLGAGALHPATMGDGPTNEAPSERYLWLYRGRLPGQELEYELGLWLREQPESGQRRREFSCALWNQVDGTPVAGREVRLRVSGGGLPGAGDLGSAVALTDQAGQAHFPIWIGGDWLTPESPANWAQAAKGGPQAGLFLVELLGEST